MVGRVRRRQRSARRALMSGSCSFTKLPEKSGGALISAEIERTKEGFRLVGDLDFVSVPGLYRRTEELLAHPRVRLDLDAVDHANSAGVALLLEWRREAQRLDVDLEFIHIPDAVMRVARLSGVEALLLGAGVRKSSGQ